MRVVRACGPNLQLHVHPTGSVGTVAGLHTCTRDHRAGHSVPGPRVESETRDSRVETSMWSRVSRDSGQCVFSLSPTQSLDSNSVLQ